jgi:hypothetical protein
MSVAMPSPGASRQLPEAVETDLQDLKEIGPHVMFSPPQGVGEHPEQHLGADVGELRL